MRRIDGIFLLLLFCYSLSFCSKIDKQLPELIKSNFTKKVIQPININIGQNFSIILPKFDSKAHYKSYTTTESQIHKMIFQNYSIQPKKQTKQQQLPYKCQIQKSNAKIKQLQTIDLPTNKNHKSFNKQNKYYYLPSKRMLYILPPSYTLQIYSYSDHTLTWIRSYPLLSQISNLSYNAQIISDYHEQFVYIFAQNKIWKVQLSNIVEISSLSSLNQNSIKISKVLSSSQGFLIILDKFHAVHIINLEMKIIKSINTFQNQPISPIDIDISGIYLYILDYKTFIYIYSLHNTQQISQYDMIQDLTQDILSFQSCIKVHKNSIFLSVNAKQFASVMQINYNLKQNTTRLVRYYKADQFITSIMIAELDIIASGINCKSHNRLQNIHESMLLISSYENVQIYPFNIDPRIISSQHNGIQITKTDLRNIIVISNNNILLLFSSYKMSLISLQISQSQLYCSISNKFIIADYLIQLSENISNCKNYNSKIMSNSKTKYQQICQYNISYWIHIVSPQNSELQKFMLYTIVALVVVAFVFALICLIHWRNHKIEILTRIKDQINRFRNKHRKMQPFTEDPYQIQDIQVQMEVPKMDYNMNKEDVQNYQKV